MDGCAYRKQKSLAVSSEAQPNHHRYFIKDRVEDAVQSHVEKAGPPVAASLEVISVAALASSLVVSHVPEDA